MSKKEQRSHPHRTSIEQLLKCYGPDHSRKLWKSETKGAISHTSSDSGTLSHLSASRHLEQRLRPQTCAACKVRTSSRLPNTLPKAAKMQPLHRTHHLPYYSVTTNNKRPNAKHKTRTGGEVTVLLQRPRCKDLLPCNEEKVTSSSPFLPALPQSGFLSAPSGGGLDRTYHPDPELRQWIVEFGGDKEAAFMARGLQKLQLAYEAGKAEMHPSARRKPATNKC
ncbi:hypothetical protein GDO81_011137 [Engystomops pustulosus]|uniref:Uncharacterized protein n=1 Tax=Engystomops pustulosus TaxID=76066 RepID=A0AAV7BC63_ENGPU|nr:hypothetical protein GDO81_011137 [Engystomops pustulosus]